MLPISISMCCLASGEQWIGPIVNFINNNLIISKRFVFLSSGEVTTHKATRENVPWGQRQKPFCCLFYALPFIFFILFVTPEVGPLIEGKHIFFVVLPVLHGKDGLFTYSPWRLGAPDKDLNLLL